MGFDCEAETIIGLKLPISILNVTIVEMVHTIHENCPRFDSSYKFCPDCGQVLSWEKTESKINPIFEGDPVTC